MPLGIIHLEKACRNSGICPKVSFDDFCPLFALLEKEEYNRAAIHGTELCVISVCYFDSGPCRAALCWLLKEIQ